MLTRGFDLTPSHLAGLSKRLTPFPSSSLEQGYYWLSRAKKKEAVPLNVIGREKNEPFFVGSAGMVALMELWMFFASGIIEAGGRTH
jgi:hypothetical protein